MSFFGMMMGDLDDDPIFGSYMRSMRHSDNMLRSLLNDPYGMLGPNNFPDAQAGARRYQNDFQMMPFGFPPMPSFNMGRLMTNFDNMVPNGNGHSYISRSVMTMQSGPDGRPQVYQESMSTRTAPGGVKETRKTVCDSQSGTKKMAIGHHIGDRAHILEREQNMHSGEREERQEFINLEEEEAESFNQEWETRTRRPAGAIAGSQYSPYAGHSKSRPDHKQLALPEPPASRHSSPSRWTPSSRRSIRQLPASKTLSPTYSSSSNSPPGLTKTASVKAPAPTTSSSASTTGNRKRQHTPDPKACKKRHAVPDSDV